MLPKGWAEEEGRRVISLVMAVPRAIDTKDTEKILTIYDTKDPGFCTFEDAPDLLGRVDGPRFRKFIGGLRKLESSSTARKDLRVDLVTRNVAVVTGMDDWETKVDGKVTKGTSRFSIVFRKKNGKWKVIHEHFTKVA